MNWTPRFPLPAYRLHLARSAALGFVGSLVWTAMLVYQVQVVGMDPLQLVLAGTAMEVSIFLCEVPTGVVADVVSRRLSALIGYALLGVSYLIQGLVPVFPAIVLGNIVWGIGHTFTSGAYEAWLVDELGQGQAAQAFMRGAQAERVGGIAGIVACALLGSLSLALPIAAGGALMIVLAAALALTMPERGFAPAPRGERSTWRHLAATLREGLAVIRSQPALMNLLLIGLFYGLFSEGWDRLWQAHLLNTFQLAERFALPVIVLFAALSLFTMALGIGAAEIVRRRVREGQPQEVSRAVLLLTALMVAGLVAYGLAPELGVALAAFVVFTQARGLLRPLWQVWLNQHISPTVRATVLSVASQIDAIGEIVGGPPIGAVGRASLRAAFLASAGILAPAVVLLRRAERRRRPPA